jgi:hypothetical protein
MDSPTLSQLEALENSALPLKKKYSKVNETLRIRFLEFIVQNNMSIK